MLAKDSKFPLRVWWCVCVCVGAGDIEDLANLYPQAGMRRSFKPEAPLEFTDCSVSHQPTPKRVAYHSC
jgi:hypothetical protein